MIQSSAPTLLRSPSIADLQAGPTKLCFVRIWEFADLFDEGLLRAATCRLRPQ